MKVHLADHFGMCFGVRDAIKMALDLTEREPITILGDLVHNPDVVAKVDAAGAKRANRIEEIQTPSVLLTAHGTSERVKLELAREGRQVRDATCPLVERAHRALDKLVRDGYFPIVIGKADHVEVVGMVGDLDDAVVIGAEADVERLARRFADGTDRRLGIVAQTTWPLERVLELVEAVRRQCPNAEVKFVDTVCQPTKDRQQALRDLAETTDVIVVVGGATSNNSQKLAELARRLGKPAYRVSNAAEIREEWFRDAAVVGVTAGTSTPDDVIDAVCSRLKSL